MNKFQNMIIIQKINKKNRLKNKLKVAREFWYN